MYTVYMKDNSSVFCSGFSTWKEAQNYGQLILGSGNFEIEREN